MKQFVFLILGLSWVPGSLAADEPAAAGSGGVKALSGMSILGNNEAPTSLVIVPWKTSELGDGIGVGNLLDERASPVDRDVFIRELGYYEIRVHGDSALSGSVTE